MKKLLGETWVDSFRVKVYATDAIDVGQFFYPKQNNPYGMIFISILDVRWWKVVGMFFHEYMEAHLMTMGTAYTPDGFVTKGSDSRLFLFPHWKLDEVALGLANAENDIYDDLKKVWKEFHKKPKKKVKKKK